MRFNLFVYSSIPPRMTKSLPDNSGGDLHYYQVYSIQYLLKNERKSYFVLENKVISL